MKIMLSVGVALMAGIAGAGRIATGISDGYLDNRDRNRVCYADEERSVSVLLDGSWYGAPASLSVDGELVLSVAADESDAYILPAGAGAVTYTLELRAGELHEQMLLTVLPRRGMCARIVSLSSVNPFLDSWPAGTLRVLDSKKAVLPTAYSSLWNADATGAEVRVFDMSGRELTAQPLVSEGEGAEGLSGFSPDALGLDGFRFRLTHFDGCQTLEAFVRAKGSGFVLIFR